MELRKKCYTVQQIQEAIDGVVNDYQKNMEIYKRLAQMEQEGEVVIRCKDCKFWHRPIPKKWAVRDTEGRFTGEYEMINTNGYCTYGDAEEDPYNFCEDDYCSRGERTCLN